MTQSGSGSTGALNLRGIAYFFATATQRAGAMVSLVELSTAALLPPARRPAEMPCEGTGHGAALGDEGKAVGCVPPTALLFVEPRSLYIRAKRSSPPSAGELTAEIDERNGDQTASRPPLPAALVRRTHAKLFHCAGR